MDIIIKEDKLFYKRFIILYILAFMANLQKKIIKGRVYWYIVECKRINGKPRPIVIAYLGSQEKLINRLLEKEEKGRYKVKSFSHGAVYALWKAQEDIELLKILDRYLPNQIRDDQSIGKSLLLCAIHRAIKPQSKKSFSEFAAGTTLPFIAEFQAKKLTSQHFWDQMDKVSDRAMEKIEEKLAEKLIQDLKIPLDVLFYDTTNFFTYINSSNNKNKLCKRGKNKQKRNDLRQFNLALLICREFFIPLFSKVYEGNIPDKSIFIKILKEMRGRLKKLVEDVEDITLVLDKGNYSENIQRELDLMKIPFVGSLSGYNHRDLLETPKKLFYEVELENGQKTLAYRTKKEIFGKSMTIVIIISNKLKEGQIRGFIKAKEKAIKLLEEIKNSLKNKRCKISKDKEMLKKKVDDITSSEHVNEVLKVRIKKVKNKFNLYYQIDEEKEKYLLEEIFGKKILFTDRELWSDKEIISSYNGLGKIEKVFKHLKGRFHFCIRPQYHWTDQKIKVHTFCCILGLILVGLVLRKVKEYGIKISAERLIEKLELVREALIIEPQEGRGKPRIRRQLEEMEDEIRNLYEASTS
jgi:transposase